MKWEKGRCAPVQCYSEQSVHSGCRRAAETNAEASVRDPGINRFLNNLWGMQFILFAIVSQSVFQVAMAPCQGLVVEHYRLQHHRKLPHSQLFKAALAPCLWIIPDRAMYTTAIANLIAV